MLICSYPKLQILVLRFHDKTCIFFPGTVSPDFLRKYILTDLSFDLRMKQEICQRMHLLD